MKYFFVVLALFSTLSADKINSKTLACPSITLLQKAPVEDFKDSMALSMYSIAHECVVLTSGDHVTAVGYDPRNSKEIYQNIIYNKTGVHLYILRSAIIIEQGGKKNTLRF